MDKSLILISNDGQTIIIPDHLRREVEDMLEFNCQACLNNLINELLKQNSKDNSKN